MMLVNRDCSCICFLFSLVINTPSPMGLPIIKIVMFIHIRTYGNLALTLVNMNSCRCSPGNCKMEGTTDGKRYVRQKEGTADSKRQEAT